MFAVICAWCLAAGRRTVVAADPTLPADSHGICELCRRVHFPEPADAVPAA
jgi:hypothetical protein